MADLPSADDDDASPASPPTSTVACTGMVNLGRDRVTAGRSWAIALFERHRHRPLVDLGLRIYERDKEAAGSVVGSAIAFRLFLFFVPLLLFVVGLLGFFAEFVSTSDVDDAGITGTIAAQINTRVAPSRTRRAGSPSSSASSAWPAPGAPSARRSPRPAASAGGCRCGPRRRCG